MSRRGRVSDSSDSGESMNTNDSGSSVSTEADKFQGDLAEIMAGNKKTDELVKRATQLIESLGTRANPNELVPQWYKRCKAKVNVILEAMLKFAPEPERGLCERWSERYVACAIVACTVGTKSTRETHQCLTDLAISWFANFLWICRLIFL